MANVTADTQFQERFQRIHDDFAELGLGKKDTYSEKKYFMKCVSSRNICENLTIPQLLTKYPGIVESLYMTELMTAEKINIDVRLAMLRWNWQHREKILMLYRDALAFYELIPNIKTQTSMQQHKLLYFDVNTQKHYQTYVNPNEIGLKFYTFTELLSAPDGVLVNMVSK